MKTRTIAPGVRIRVASGDKGMMSFVDLEAHAVIPVHQHPHEQMGIVLEGAFDFLIGEERRTVRAGDSYVIPGNTPHGVWNGPQPSRALDFFSPPREDYR